MYTLLDQIIDELRTIKKTPEDVLWVGDSLNYVTWNEFAAQAILEKEIINTSSTREIPITLVIVGCNWWLDRDYDSEWLSTYWVYHSCPVQPASKKPYTLDLSIPKSIK